ncbi:MAG: peptidase M16, partial [Phascolarctobacterium sp.]
NPLDGLRYKDALIAMRKGLTNNFYESLIENYLLDNTHKVIVTLLPKPGKEEEDQAKAAAKMAALKASMSQQELEQYAFECAELHRLQAEPDSEEARAAIPILKRSDIRRQVESIEKQEESNDEQRLVYVPAETNKIAYTNWYFDISSVTPEQMPLCYLLTDVLGKFNSKRYTYEELSTYGIMYTGGVTFDVRAISAAEDANDYRLYFVVKAKALLENLPHVFDLLEAIGLESLLTDVKRFKELLSEVKTDWDDEFFNRGQTIAISRLYSYCAAGARANEQDQFSYYQFLKKLYDNFANEGNKVLAQLQELAQHFFQQSNYTLFYSCDAEDREQVRSNCLAFASKLPQSPVVAKPAALPAPGHNEGITTAGKVQYVAAGGSFAKFGHRYVGAMKVLETILRYEYLWTKIRIQGGAYGATARFELNGLGVFASYRDPQLAKSLDAYKELPAWLKSVEFPARELDKYVIGTISGMDTPLTNTMRMDQAALQYLKQLPDSTRQRVRNEVLDVSNTDLQALGKVVEDMLSDGLICVVGGKQAIEANKEKFTEIINA